MQLKLIDENRYAEDMNGRVLPALAECRVEGWMEPAEVAGVPTPHSVDGSSGGRLHYVCYDSAKFDALREDGATGVFRGAVVISHGFTEFAAKYAEMVWYFLMSGYSVCVLEHRGHGYSVRDVDNRSLVWIDDWRRYEADLAKFADTVGKRYADGQPLDLYCHSMGGGIGAAVGLAEALCSVGLGRHVVFGQSDFSPELDMSAYRGASEARIRWFHEQRVNDVHQQTNAATFEWVRQALRLSRAVQRQDACANIETPILLFQAGRDVWVLNKPQDRFVRNVTAAGGDIRKSRFDDSLHEIFSMPNAVLGPYLTQIFDFLGASEMETIAR